MDFLNRFKTLLFSNLLYLVLKIDLLEIFSTKEDFLCIFRIQGTAFVSQYVASRNTSLFCDGKIAWKQRLCY